MSTKKIGRQTAALAAPPSILCAANVVGRMEGEGPLAACFDYIDQDDTFGEATWEQSERAMQQKALALALQKGALTAQQLDWLFAGDLLNQCVSSSYAAREQKIPFFGLYGACSTFGEGLILASMALDGGFGERAGVVVSSHFCTAERQYRTPLEYGGQRTPTAQWTVTGSGCVILSAEGAGPRVTHVTTGKIVDKGIRDANNMGAAMAPAAYDTLCAHFQDTGRGPDFYDCIVTGDLGELGGELLCELFRQDGVDLFGFATQEELNLFQQLTSVSGVGPKAALSILSASTPANLALSIITGDEKALTVAQGIGKKIAQRIILELKDKLAKGQTASLQGESYGGSGITVIPENKLSEASAALAVLGYSQGEINLALKGVDLDSLTLEQIIKEALKKMMKG